MHQSKSGIDGKWQYASASSLRASTRSLKKSFSRSNRPSLPAASAVSDMSDADDDSVMPSHEILLAKLAELYDIIKDTFFALDADQTGHIDLVNGASIQKGLTSAGLGALWTLMVGQADTNAELTHDAFVKVFLKWAGVDEGSPTGISPDKAFGRMGKCAGISCTPAVTQQIADRAFK